MRWTLDFESDDGNVGQTVGFRLERVVRSDKEPWWQAVSTDPPALGIAATTHGAISILVKALRGINGLGYSGRDLGELAAKARADLEQRERMAGVEMATTRDPRFGIKIPRPAKLKVNLCPSCSGSGKAYRYGEASDPVFCTACKGTGESGGVVSGEEVACRHCGAAASSHVGVDRICPSGATPLSTSRFAMPSFGEILQHPVVRAAMRDHLARGALTHPVTAVSGTPPAHDVPPVPWATSALEASQRRLDELETEMEDAWGELGYGFADEDGNPTIPEGTLAEAIAERVKSINLELAIDAARARDQHQAELEAARREAADAKEATAVARRRMQAAERERDAAMGFKAQRDGGASRPSNEELIEAAYWQFDAVRAKAKGDGRPMSERDAFKMAARALVMLAIPSISLTDDIPSDVEVALVDMIRTWPGLWYVSEVATQLETRINRKLHGADEARAVGDGPVAKIKPCGPRSHAAGEYDEVQDVATCVSCEACGGICGACWKTHPENPDPDAHLSKERIAAALADGAAERRAIEDKRGPAPTPTCGTCGDEEGDHGPDGACLAVCGGQFQADKRTAADGLWPPAADRVVAELENRLGPSAVAEVRKRSYGRRYDDVMTELLFRVALIEGPGGNRPDFQSREIKSLRSHVADLEQAVFMFKPTQVRVRLVGEGGKVPQYMTAGAAAADLRAAVTCERQVQVGGSWRVPLGVAVEIPQEFVGLVLGRSGGFESGLIVHPGTIDPDYRGEIHALLKNHGREAFTIKPGERIAQLLILPKITAEFVVSGALSDTERGSRGFGHSGNT